MKNLQFLKKIGVFLGVSLTLLLCPPAAKGSGFSDIARLARASRFNPGVLPFSFEQALSYFDAGFRCRFPFSNG